MDLFTRRRKQPIVPEQYGGQGPRGSARGAGGVPGLLPDRAGGQAQAPTIHKDPLTRPAIGDLAAQARLVELEARVNDLQTKMEGRLDNLHANLTRSIESKWEKFEQYDRRFKEYIRGEQEVNQSQLVNLKSSGMEYIVEKGKQEKKLVNDLELKIIHMDTKMGQMGVLMEKIITGGMQNSQAELEMLMAGDPNDPTNPDNLRLLSSRLNRLPNGETSTTQDRLAQGGILNPLVSPRKGMQLLGQGASMLNYNVALEHLTRQLKFEQESRQVLQEETAANFKQMYEELKNFMQANEHEFLKDKRAQLQQEHDNRIIKISEGAVNDAVAKLKLALDVVDSKHDNRVEESLDKQQQTEQKMLENLALATEHQGKNARDLWDAHIAMGSQWKEAVGNLQVIIDHRNSILQADLDRKINITNDLREKGFVDQKKVNDAFDGRLAKAELVVLEQGQKLQARYQRLEEEEQRWEREFSSLSVVLNHMKTKLGVVGKSQAQLEESCIKKIQENCESISALCQKVTTDQYEKFQNLIEKQKQYIESVDSLNKENRRLCVADISNTDKKLQGSMSELTGSVTRMLQQSEFDHRTLLAQKLEEEKEYVVSEIKAMESNNVELRMQLHAKLDATESQLLDKIATVDRKCYTALQSEKKYILDFEKKTNDWLKKFQHTTENRQSKFETETNSKLNDQQVMLAKDIADVWRKLEAECKYMEKSCVEMMNRIKDHELNIENEIETLRKFWQEKFGRELDTLEQKMRQELLTEIEKERADRIAGEAERIRATQKRFEAFEELMDKRFTEADHRIKNYMDTLDKRLDVHMQENSNLLEKKFNQLTNDIRDFRYDFDQNNIRLEEKRIADLEKVTEWKNEVEARQLAHQYAYEKTFRVFMNIHFEDQQDELDRIRRDMKANAQTLWRGIDKEKMDRIKSMGEFRSILEGNMEKGFKKMDNKMEDADTKWTKKTDTIVEDQDLENQRIRTEVGRVETEGKRYLKNTEDRVTQETDEKLLSAQVSSQAALDGLAETMTKNIDELAEKVTTNQIEITDKLQEEVTKIEEKTKTTDEAIEEMKTKAQEDMEAQDTKREEAKTELETKLSELDDKLETSKKERDEKDKTLKEDTEALQKELDAVNQKIDDDVGNLEKRLIPEQMIDDIIGKLNKVPSNVKETVETLDKKLESNIQTIVAAQETAKFLTAESDFAADSMTNKFLQTILADTESLKSRINALELIQGVVGDDGDAKTPTPRETPREKTPPNEAAKDESAEDSPGADEDDD